MKNNPYLKAVSSIQLKLWAPSRVFHISPSVKLHCAPLDSHRKRFFTLHGLSFPPSNLLHWPVCLWEKLAAPSSTIHYSPQASSVTLQCFRSPVASTPQQPKMLQYISVSHSPTSKHSVSGCCMPVSSQNLANPGSSLCLSPSHCACDCVCCDWPGLKGKPGGEGKCRTSACMCKIETLSLWVAVLMRVGGGRLESIAQSAQVPWFISGRLQALFWKALGVTFGRRFPQCLDYLCLFLERSEVLRLPTLDKEMFGMEQLTKSYHFRTRPKLSKCYVVTRSLFKSVFGMTEHSKLNLVHWVSVPVVANVVWAVLKPVPFGSFALCLYKPAVLRHPFIKLEWYVISEAEQAMWGETFSSSFTITEK